MGARRAPEPFGMTDRTALYVTAFVRSVTTGLFGVLAAVYLARLGLSPATIGILIAAGLGGAAAAALLATLTADRIGRRRFLIAVAILSGAGMIAFALVTSPVLLGVAAFVGMLNGMGRDRGAALVLEQAALPATASDQERTRVIAVYTMLQDLGHAGGALLAGLPVLMALAGTMSGVTPHRLILIACGCASLVTVLLYARLGAAVDGARATKPAPLSASSRRVLTKLSALFALDGLGGGFLTTAMLAYFFFERFGVREAGVGALFFGARIMNAGSHMGAAWLAKRIGLVNTMVFTHIPSSLLLVTVAFAPSFPVAAALFLLREGLVEMDVPTRQSYVFAVVGPEERTRASGITNLVRLGAWAVAPALGAASLGSGRSLFIPLVIGASMKVAYDVLLYIAFRNARPPEERAAAG